MGVLRGSRVLVAGLLLSAMACTHHRRSATDSRQEPRAEPEVHVYVTNHYEISLEISVIGSGITHRLGVVAPGIPRSFVLPQALTGSGGEVEFLAQQSGGGPVIRSGSLHVSPGNLVDFEITTNLVGSHATVRN